MRKTIGLVTAGQHFVRVIKKRTARAQQLLPLAVRERLVTNPQDLDTVWRARGSRALHRRSGTADGTEVERYMIWRSFAWPHSAAIDAVLDHREALLAQQSYQERGAPS